MNPSRRTALYGAAALLAAAASACTRKDEALSPPVNGTGSEDAVTGGERIDEETLAFWENTVREPAVLHAQGLVAKDSPIANPVFVYYSPELGFRATYDPELGTLPDAGSLDVLLRVERFRPAVSDRDKLGSLQQGSLRIDLQQTKPMPNLAEALAWSAVAAFIPEANGKLPALQHLQFDPGTAWGKLQTIPIPDGLGFWAWNFFVQRKESAWSRYLSMLRPIAESAVPFLGLPAIAVSALQQVDKLMGVIQSTDRTRWLMQSTAMPVYGTRAAAEQVGGSGIALRSGRYLVLPSDQLSDFGKEGDKVKLTPEGLLVPKATSSMDVYKASDDFMPGLRYLSVYVKATVTPNAKPAG